MQKVAHILPVRIQPVSKPAPSFAELCNADDFNGGFMHIFHMLYIGIQKHLEQTLSASGSISFSQFVILVGFSSNNGLCASQAKLAELLMLTEATVSRHISTLVTMKLLSKEKDAANKKSFNLVLTPHGAATFMEAKTIIMRELEVIFSHISEKDREIILNNFRSTLTLLQHKK